MVRVNGVYEIKNNLALNNIFNNDPCQLYKNQGYVKDIMNIKQRHKCVCSTSVNSTLRKRSCVSIVYTKRMELCAIILLHFIKAALWDGMVTNLHLHDMASEYGSGSKPRYGNTNLGSM